MLIEFYGKNFGCFRDEFRLSMVAAKIDPGDDRGIVEVKVDGQEEPLRLLRAVAIYGANASGKSTVLRAAETLGEWLAGNLLPPAAEYLAFAGTGSAAPVEIGAVFWHERQLLEYRIELDQHRITHEMLTPHSVAGDPTPLFVRRNGKLEGTWAKNQVVSVLFSDIDDGVPMLPTAAKYAKTLAGDIAKSLRSCLQTPPARGIAALVNNLADRFATDSTLRDWASEKLAWADAGVTEILLDERKPSLTGIRPSDDLSILVAGLIRGKHLALSHGAGGGKFNLPFTLESLGTQKFLTLLPVIYDLTHGEDSATAFVDEIHESLHPTLLQAIIRDFNCDTPMDRVRGQLIFTTHETMLLDAEAKNNILRRDQIYFTKKLADGSSQLYSLVEFKERNNLNLRKRYLEGRYGALPAVDGGEEAASEAS